MRTLLLLGAGLFSVAILVAHGESTQQVIIGEPRDKRPPTEEQRKVLDQVESSVADALQEQFSCVKPTTPADLREKHGEAKGQELATDDETSDVNQMAQLMGARDVVTVTVTPTAGGTFYVQLSYMDRQTARTSVREGGEVDGSEGAADDLARRFAQKLQNGEPRFAKANLCAAEREWSGVIRYSFTAEPKSKNVSKECTEEMRSRETWKYSVRIPANGTPSAVVFVTRVQIKDMECKRKVMCGTARGWVDETYYNQGTWQWIGAKRLDARVSFDDVQGKVYMSVDLPMVPTVATYEGRAWYVSVCKEPDQKPTSQEAALPLVARVPRIPAQPAAAGQKKLSGSATDPDGGQVSWRLTRTNKK